MLPSLLPHQLGRIRFIYFGEGGMSIPVAPLLGWRYLLLRLIRHPQTIALRTLLKKKAPLSRRRVFGLSLMRAIL